MEKQELINAINNCNGFIKYYTELSECEMLSMSNMRHLYASYAVEWRVKLNNFTKQLEELCSGI